MHTAQMKASRFGPSEAFILEQEADGIPVADICRTPGPADLLLLEACDGLLPDEMRRLKQFEDEKYQAQEAGG